MSTIRKRFAALLCTLLMLLCACGEKPEEGDILPPEEESGPYTLAVRAGEPQTTLSPAAVTAQGGETILHHLFENLLRWTDGGDGWAVLESGQAESYTVETDYAGNATYTFTIREDARWSDGKAVTAEDFVTAWQRLADPSSNLPHRELMSALTGFDEVLEDGTAAPLGVSAPDSRTLVATLNGSPAWFLEEVCAGAYTMPVRPDLVNQSDGAVTNGAYTAVDFSREQVSLKRSETYYNTNPLGPEVIEFRPADAEDGDLTEPALTTALPSEQLRELAASGLWTPEPVTGIYGVLLNTRTAPFDNENVRTAFHLAIDRQSLAEALGDLTIRSAPGVVPYGVSDYSARPPVEIEADGAPADPIAGPEPEKPAPTCRDFRSHSLELVTAEHTHDYETDRSYAQALLANAGYPGGSGFPAAEYLYVEQTGLDGQLARVLCDMWKESLGVTVTVREAGQEEYDALLAPPPPEEADGEAAEAETEEGEEAEPLPAFQMAGQLLSPAYSDAGALLRFWHSENTENATGYASDAFDILLDAARDTASPDAQDAYLHDAEAILLKDSPVIPVYCQGGSFRLSGGYAGLYRAPDGVFFLYNVHREAAAG